MDPTPWSSIPVLIEQVYYTLYVVSRVQPYKFRLKNLSVRFALEYMQYMCVLNFKLVKR